MSREVGGAIGTFVSFGRRRLGSVLTVTWKTHLTGWSPWVLHWHWAREGKCAVTRIVARIWRYQLVMMLLLLLLLVVVVLLWRLLRHVFLCRIRPWAGRHINGRSTGCGRRITIAKARKADRARVHGISRDSGLFWYHEGGFCCLVGLRAHGRKRGRCI